MNAMWNDDILGWRGRVGIIIPSTNLLLETALPRMSPKGVTFHASRLSTSPSATVQSLTNMSKKILIAANDLAEAKVDLIVYCCTASSFIDENHDSDIINMIEEQTNIPTLTTMNSIVEALHILNINRPVVISPYSEELEALEIKYLKLKGFEIINNSSMGISDMIGLHYPSPGDVYRLATSTWDNNSNGILISCNALRSHVIVEELENNIKYPVVTSLTATLWGILRALKITVPLKGLGRLLEFESENK